MEAQQEAHYDAKFEFDAPRYYDFEVMSDGTPCDKWFDTAPDGPGSKPPKRDAAPSQRLPLQPIQQQQPNQQQEAAAGAAADAAAAAAAAPPDKEPPSGTAATDKPACNIVKSWGLSPKGGVQKAQQRSTKPRPGSSKTPGGGAGAGCGAGSPEAGASAAPAAAAAAAAPGTSKPSTRKSTGQHLRGRVPRRISMQDAVRSEPPVTRSRTRLGLHLCSPVAEGRPRRGSPPATRARTAATSQKARTCPRTRPASMAKLCQVLQPKVTKPPRSTKPLTLPDDFELETSKRGGAAAAAAAAAGQQPGKSPFKSLAQKVREFQCKTPVRFKTKPARPASGKQRSPITKPELMTSTRSRPPRFKSQAELEVEAAEQAQREQFHARPLDTRVLSSSGQLGVPKVDKPQLTQVQPFKLRSDSRAKVRRSHEHASAEQAAAAAKFRAQPVKKSILDGPTFRPAKEALQATVPKSPLLRTRLRSHAGAKAGEPKSSTANHARPLSAGASSSGLQGKAVTQPQPFALHTAARGALHQDELAAKLAAEEARAKRLRRVTARPLPVSVDVPMVPPRPEPKPLTLPHPFELKSLSRHEEFEEQHRRKLQEEQEAARRAAEFKARPLAVGGPFSVHESDAPLTVPVDPHLETETRAAERHKFDAHMAEMMQQAEEERQRQQELKRQREEEAVKEYRKKLRFSARPMPRFDHPYFAMPSEKPLTNPQTPNFASKKLKRNGPGQ